MSGPAPPLLLPGPSARPPASPGRSLGVLIAANVLGWAAHMTYMYYLAPIALRVGGIEGRDAWIFAGTAIAMGAAVVPAGRLADRIPRRYVMRMGLALLGLAYAALLVPPRFEALFLGTLATGAGLALLFVSFTSYVADLLGEGERGVAYGRAGALTVLASAAGPALAAFVFRGLADDALGLRVNAWIFGLGALAGVGLTALLPRMRSASHTPQERGRWVTAARAALPVSVVYLFMGAGYGMTAPYFTVFFLDHVGLEKTTWGYLLAAGTIASAVGSIIAGELARRRPPMRTALVGQTILLAASLVFAFPVGVTLLALAFLGRNLTSTSTAPGLNALLMARAGPARRAEASGYSSLGWNGGWTIGAALGGMVLSRLGGASFALGGALALAGVVVGALLLRERPRRGS